MIYVTVISVLFFIAAVIPFTSIKHWIVRNQDFLRIQYLVLSVVAIFISWFLSDKIDYFLLTQAFLLGSILVHFYVLFPYFKRPPYIDQRAEIGDGDIKLISFNVYQYNDQFQDLIDIVYQYKPHILLTMETDQKWTDNIKEIEALLPNKKLIPLDNLYGMNFYTNLEIVSHKVHYFMTLERPTLEMNLKDQTGREFVFFGFHPPPPSPTEETNSKEKDGELVLLARRVREIEKPIVIAGDFNNVCWSSITKTFCKISGLQDSRLSNGFKSTFPSNYRLLRYPLDLLFYSQNIHLTTIDTLSNIGSDHLPLFASFSFDNRKLETKTINEKEFIEETEEIVQQGKEEAHKSNDS